MTFDDIHIGDIVKTKKTINMLSLQEKIQQEKHVVILLDIVIIIIVIILLYFQNNLKMIFHL